MEKSYDMELIDTVASIFISKMYYLLTEQYDCANVSFYFKEKEARDYLKNMVINGEYSRNVKEVVLNAIDNVDYSLPVIYVSDYKKFFSLLMEYAKKFSNDDRAVVYMSDLGFSMDYLWLKMTPDDFNNVEEFIKKNISILDDTTFKDYDDSEIKGTDFYENQKILVSSSRTCLYDESNNEIKFILEDEKNRFCLPLIRYGIYEKDGNKVCEIGSIQDKYSVTNKRYFKDYYEYINSLRTNINEGVNDKKLIYGIEPNKFISLLLFIRLLYEKGINNISIPSMYVLDYSYHVNHDKKVRFNFESKWTQELKELSPIRYEECYKEFLKQIDKQDSISRNKTTNFIKIFERLIYHIQDVDIISYPMDVSSYFNFRINSFDNINSEQVKKILKP